MKIQLWGVYIKFWGLMLLPRAATRPHSQQNMLSAHFVANHGAQLSHFCSEVAQFEPLFPKLKGNSAAIFTRLVAFRKTHIKTTRYSFIGLQKKFLFDLFAESGYFWSLVYCPYHNMRYHFYFIYWSYYIMPF